MAAAAVDELHKAVQGCGPLLTGGRKVGHSLRQQVFEFVRARGQTARADITRALGISAGSVTTITADLIAARLLHEVEGPAREQGRGRPPVALEVVAMAGHVIGIKLAFDSHTAVLSDFNGTVIAEAEMASGDDRRSAERLLAEVSELIDLLLAKSTLSLSDIKTLGVGLPGIVEHSTGLVIWSSILQDRDQDLGGLFEDRFGVPVALDNDANMLTLAELWFGAGRSMSNFAVVTIESGVGMGLVLDNQLYRGAHGMGLELGHTKVQLDGALCQCGQRGCLEAYLADYALIREASTALGQGFDSIGRPDELLGTLFEQAKQGQQAAQTIFRRAGRYLSVGLSNVIQLFDPALIILSGGQMKYDYLYANAVIEEMQKLTLNEGRKPCKVEIQAWGDWVWARGASALALASLTDVMVGGEGNAR